MLGGAIRRIVTGCAILCGTAAQIGLNSKHLFVFVKFPLSLLPHVSVLSAHLEVQWRYMMSQHLCTDRNEKCKLDPGMEKSRGKVSSSERAGA